MIKGLSATLENYLEAIFRLEEEKGFARVRDISSGLDVAKSAVTTALQSLSEKGLVRYEPYEPVRLSAEGRRETVDKACEECMQQYLKGAGIEE
jgi:DtxR family Mn-dependent transcriptional regulator